MTPLQRYFFVSIIFSLVQPAYAETYVHPSDSLSVSLSSGAGDSGQSGSISVEFFSPDDRYQQWANASTASGLGASTSFRKLPAPYLQSDGGNTWAGASMRDRIVVAHDSCEFFYANTGLEVLCNDVPGAISLPIAPKLSYHSNFITTVQLGTNTPSDAYSGGIAEFNSSYGAGSVMVRASRCATVQNYNNDPNICTDTGISTDGSIFPTTGDESSSVAGWVVGDPFQLPLGESGSASFDIELRLRVTADSHGRGESIGLANADALNTFTFYKEGPVIDLPDGYTAYSTSGMIRDNLNFGHYHIYSSGFE